MGVSDENKNKSFVTLPREVVGVADMNGYRFVSCRRSIENRRNFFAFTREVAQKEFGWRSHQRFSAPGKCREGLGIVID